LRFSGIIERMLRPTPLVAGETYHIYNRGAGKARIFSNERDCLRFQILLYLANSSESVRLEDLLRHYKSQGRSLRNVFVDEETDKPFAEVLAYSLMPNHFHIILKQKSEDGITQLMKKVCTAYSMYYNIKYERSGVLFEGRFKSSHIDTDPYFRWVFAYVHLNPVELVASKWKEDGIRNPRAVRKYLNDYRYSSFRDYAGDERPERAILAYDEAPDFLKTQNDLEEMLADFKKGRVLHEE